MHAVLKENTSICLFYESWRDPWNCTNGTKYILQRTVSPLQRFILIEASLVTLAYS